MLKKDLYNMRFSIIVLFLYFTIMQITFGNICPLKALTGFPCPACGLTHATFYLFTFNIESALKSNPTVFLWIPSIFLFIYDRYIHKLKIDIFPALFIIVGIITIFIYFFNIFIYKSVIF